MFSIVRSMWITFMHMFHKRETVQYPEQKNKLTTRWRGRIVLTRDPDMGERCVGVTCAPLPVLWIVFRCKPRKMKMEEGILSFFELIFHDAFSAGIVKKPVQHMPFN